MSLNRTLRAALLDCAEYSYGKYIWKPKSMEKLARMGYVKEEGEYCGKQVFVITKLGHTALESSFNGDGK